MQKFQETELEEEWTKKEIFSKKFYILAQLCVSTFGVLEIFVVPKFEMTTLPLLLRLIISMMQIVIYFMIYKTDVPKE